MKNTAYYKQIAASATAVALAVTRDDVRTLLRFLIALRLSGLPAEGGNDGFN